MITAITILAGIGVLWSIIKGLLNGKFHCETFISTIFVILCWNSAFALSIITIVLWVLLTILGVLTYEEN